MAVQYSYEHHNVRKIFNHDIPSGIREDVAGNHLYSGRALGLSEPHDIIQIHPFLKREWEAISGHYDRVGLPHSKNVVWDVSLDRLEEFPELQASVFFFGPSENRVRSHRTWQQVVAHINNRNNFVALATHLRLDVPYTLCFRGKQWFAGIDKFTYPCYLKLAVSAGGKDIHRCENASELIKALAYFDDGVPLQVQEEVCANIFLNLQYEATDQGVERLLATQHVLTGSTRQSSRFPARCEPWGSVEPIALWLWRKGIRDVFSFDVGVIEEIDGLRFVLIECVPRYNAASYPSKIARRLQIPQWIAKELSGHYDKLSDIDLEGIEYNPEHRSGIVLVNWGTILIGRLGVLFAGTLIQQKQLEAALRERLQ
ncbi:MAG: ATP-grasp domain-containing protein [Gammaproteobacteria bacterium]|nr:ATP-grasp domain-containing protein [Gammaproteobacteria bacterium]